MNIEPVYAVFKGYYMGYRFNEEMRKTVIANDHERFENGLKELMKEYHGYDKTVIREFLTDNRTKVYDFLKSFYKDFLDKLRKEKCKHNRTMEGGCPDCGDPSF